ncbi:glycosyltransferase family 9 protein [Candidatus Parcubacteria bacterium]|nr:glycosyltransferase family 9 protein [Candidatus Parcubacteria bacterium]
MSERWQFFILVAVAYALLPFSRWRKRQPAQGKPGILIVQTGKIGDVVCTTPIFRAIKRTWPDADLGVAVTAFVAPLLSGNPYVDDVWLFNDEPGLKGKLKLIRKIRQHGYHWVLVFTPAAIGVIIGVLAGIPNRAMTLIPQLPRLTRSALAFANHYVSYELRTSAAAHYCRMLSLVGSVQCDDPRELFPSDAAVARAERFLIEHALGGAHPCVGIAVAAGKSNKEWPPERFGALGDLLIEQYGAKIVWIGSAGDAAAIAVAERAMRHKDKAVSAAGAFALGDLSALLKRLSLFISVDTGPLYMADAVGVPVIDIAGPHDIRSQTPLGRFAVVHAEGIAPSLTMMAAPDSPERDPAIMAISVEQVWNVTRDFISREQLVAPRA